MNQELRKNKGIIRDFLKTAYSDIALIKVLDHSRNGGMSYYSCCCLIGAATADFPLHKMNCGGLGGPHPDSSLADLAHWKVARALPNARGAEMAFQEIGSDELRRTRLIPLILAEIRRRRLATDQPSPIEAEGVVAHD